MRDAMIDLSLQSNAAGQPFWDTYAWRLAGSAGKPTAGP